MLQLLFLFCWSFLLKLFYWLLLFNCISQYCRTPNFWHWLIQVCIKKISSRSITLNTFYLTSNFNLSPRTSNSYYPGTSMTSPLEQSAGTYLNLNSWFSRAALTNKNKTKQQPPKTPLFHSNKWHCNYPCAPIQT